MAPHYNRRCEIGRPTSTTGVTGRLNLLLGEDCRSIGIVYHRTRNIGETLLSLASVGPKQHERSVHIDRTALSQYAFSLFDDHPGAERGLKLLIDQIRVGHGSVMQYPNRSNVGEGLADCDISRRKGTDLGEEQVQSTDAGLAKPHWQRGNRPIVVFGSLGGEGRPTFRLDTEIVNYDRFAGAIRTQAGADVGLYLKQFK